MIENTCQDMVDVFRRSHLVGKPKRKRELKVFWIPHRLLRDHSHVYISYRCLFIKFIAGWTSQGDPLQQAKASHLQWPLYVKNNPFSAGPDIRTYHLQWPLYVNIISPLGLI